MQSHLLYIIYIVYIHTNVFIYPIHIIYNFSLSEREIFGCWNWVLKWSLRGYALSLLT